MRSLIKIVLILILLSSCGGSNEESVNPATTETSASTTQIATTSDSQVIEISTATTATTTTTTTEPLDSETVILVTSYNWMETSERVAELQRLLKLEDDGTYGPGTRSAHVTENEIRGLETDMVPSPPTEINPVNVAVVAPGMDYTVTGSGFTPGSTATATLYSNPVLLGTVVADDNGHVNIGVTIPADTPVGEHTLELAGKSFTGEETTTSTSITIGIDNDNPSVSNVTASHSSVDITSSPATVTVELSAADSATGVYAGGATYACEGGSAANPSFSADMSWNDGEMQPGWNGQLVSGTVNNGIWRGTFEVPAGIPACTLSLAVVSICDQANNCISGSPTTLGISPSHISVTRND